MKLQTTFITRDSGVMPQGNQNQKQKFQQQKLDLRKKKTVHAMVYLTLTECLERCKREGALKIKAYTEPDYVNLKMGFKPLAFV